MIRFCNFYDSFGGSWRAAQGRFRTVDLFALYNATDILLVHRKANFINDTFEQKRRRKLSPFLHQ
jgi:hypothetical protein